MPTPSPMTGNTFNLGDPLLIGQTFVSDGLGWGFMAWGDDAWGAPYSDYYEGYGKELYGWDYYGVPTLE